MKKAYAIVGPGGSIAFFCIGAVDGRIYGCADCQFKDDYCICLVRAKQKLWYQNRQKNGKEQADEALDLAKDCGRRVPFQGSAGSIAFIDKQGVLAAECDDCPINYRCILLDKELESLNECPEENGSEDVF